MQYRTNPKNGDKLSALGLGCMRFPRKGGRIDQNRANELVKAAIDSGINYFDTAYIYPGSEEALGKALAASGRRDEIKIATKLPHYIIRNGDFDKYFSAHLERLQTDRIDYYLIHMLSNIESWERLCAQGIEDWISQKRSEGKIINVGFSFHGGRQAFVKLLDTYDWDFCMVQYNYLDENNQAGRDGVTYASQKGLPVFVMEPLRGGLLADKIPDAARKAFSKENKERSLPDWGLRWVLNHKEITLVLSGMSDLQQIAQNAETADSAAPDSLSEAELGAYKEAVAAIKKAIKVPCTGCGYCMPCPRGVDIPACFSCYNETYTSRFSAGMSQYFQVTGQMAAAQSDASLCVSCGKCEKNCPQSIHISKELKNVRRRMKTFAVKPFMKLVRFILNIR